MKRTCPKCGFWSDYLVGNCPECGTQLKTEQELAYPNGMTDWDKAQLARAGDAVPVPAARRKFPGVLWLLPIFLGLIGGIVAAMIANMKYQASWWELLTVGILLNIVLPVAILIIAFN